MVNFLDFYGRKFRYINIDNNNQNYLETLDQLKLKGDEPGYIKMQNDVQSQDCDSHDDTTISDVIDFKRKAKEMKDLELILQAKGTID